MKIIALILFLTFQASAQEDCAGYGIVKGFKSSLSNKCLGLVASQKDVPWIMPREIIFKDAQTILVSDLGGWASSKDGAVWQLNLKTSKIVKIYGNGNKTHGLGLDDQNRVIVGDVDKIIRLNGINKYQTLISGLPTRGSHPLSQFILLPNNDLVLNIGAPSDNCQEEMGGGTFCGSRDSQGELRLYFYDKQKDNYRSQYQVLAHGLRNSMALLYNPILDEIYQGENNMDQLGTTEELNLIPLTQENANDYGWPFCVGFNREAKNLKASFKNFCNKISVAPLFLIPAHSAPLDMIYYYGDEHPELQDSILMSWHGHRRTRESALVAYDIDQNKSPRVESLESNPFLEILSGLNNKGEKLRPVGIATDSVGKIWFVDDVTKKLYVFAASDGAGPIGDDLSTDQSLQTFNSISLAEISQFEKIYQGFQSSQTCTKCHSQEDFPVNSKLALKQWLKKGWIKKEIPAENMVLMERISPHIQSPRSMPPPPELPYGKKNPQVYEDLMVWLNFNLR